MKLLTLHHAVKTVTGIDIHNKSRKDEVVLAKKLFIFFARDNLELIHKDIAEYINLDESTIRHHIKDACFLINHYKEIRVKHDKIKYVYSKMIDNLN